MKSTKPQNEQSDRYDTNEDQKHSKLKQFTPKNTSQKLDQNLNVKSQQKAMIKKKKLRAQRESTPQKDKSSPEPMTEKDLEIANIEVPAKFQKDE